MKALILSCNTGQGHNTAGHAILEALRLRGITSEMKDALSFGTQNASRYISGSYIKMTQVNPKLFGTLYHAGDAISRHTRKSPVYFANALYAGKLRDYILENGYDTIICPHLFPAETLTYLRRKQELKIKQYAVSTDYTCIPFFKEIDMDAFFIPLESQKAEFIAKGMEEKKLIATGIPVSRAFQEKTAKQEARRLLELPQEKNLYLLMSGSMGFGDVPDIARMLLRLSDDNTWVLALTGHNHRLSSLLKEQFAEDARLKIIDYTKKVALYMDACDVLLSKPGGLSSTEAVVKNVPFVHTAGIPGCETVNMRLFGEMGISIPTMTPLESALAAKLLFADDSLRERMLTNQRQKINGKAADDIVDYLLAHQ
ncbi:MAG: glycosyl transferase [Eubacteriales bacterium]|nr:glycosyl transferase [Eubacteriales bacterium]